MSDTNIILSHFNHQWQDHLHTVYKSKQNAYIIYLYDQWNLGMISLPEFRQLIQLNMGETHND
jgi:hypothetical protein